MATIHNSETVKRILNDAGIQTAHDQTPQELARKVVPVLVANPEKIVTIAKRTNAIDDASEVIMTTSSTKRTFITGAVLTVAKDANSTSLFSNIQIVLPSGDIGFLTYLRYEPTTAGQHQQVVNFEIPIELQKGSAVTLQNGTAVASIDTTALVFGYEVDERS